jgi:serine/threonine-protein kinase
VLGQGGMGDVYLVKHMVMRKRLALKLLRPELSQIAEFAARFEREALAAAHIDHPHVAAATDCGKAEDGTFFLALEYVEGQSLRQALQGGALPLERALHIAHQVARALKRAHELGITHRDLKPENIMLTQRDGDPDFVKVLDFGLAKLSAGAGPGGTAATAQKLTQLGEIFGTPQYMAPEQTTGGEADGRTDLYALGLILYEMLAGKPPFEGRNISDFLRHQLVTPLPPLRQRAPQAAVPESIEALVRRLCEKRPEDRFQSAEQLREALELAAQQHNLVLAPSRGRASSPSLRDQASGAAVVTPPGALAQVTPRAAALPNTASMVLFMQAVGRAQQRLPEPLQRVSAEKLAALLAVLAVVVFVGVFFGISALRSAGQEPADKARPPAPPVKAATTPTAEELQAAAAAGIPGLQQLVQRFPEAPAALRALASAYLRNGQAGPALSTIGQLARRDPQALDSPEFIQFVTAQVMSAHEETANAALRVVERDFGDRGVDLLIKWADGVPARSRGRFNTSFTNLRARTDLSPATRALLELRAASKCEQKHVALLRVRQSGDARSLPLLYALQTPTGCAPFGLGDCWGCLRQGTDLEDTIQAVISRTGGAAPTPAAETDEDSDDSQAH